MHRVPIHLATQVFELAAVEASGGEGCFPVAEMQAQHKLSCLVWSGYLKSSLLAADYAGMLQMWDVNQRVPTTSFHQHTKRVWSADFCPVSWPLALSIRCMPCDVSWPLAVHVTDNERGAA